eukprot:EG_transcript_12473
MKASMTVAFAYYETASDLGWTWRHNQGRVYMQTNLQELYPSVSFQSIYAENVPLYPECSPLFEGWAAAGVDLIVGTSYGFEQCMSPLAFKYRRTVWLAVSGLTHPNVTNWGTAWGRIYQPTYLAGIVAAHASKTGKLGCVMPLKVSDTLMALDAFALGVAHVNASYEVHVGWTNNWNSPLHEILGTDALASIGVDVVFYRVDGIEGLREANRLGLFIVGFNGDDRMLLGETVLTSPYINWGVIYLQIAEMVLLETFDSSTPIALFPGMREGAVALTDTSFLLKKSALEDMGAARDAILNGSDPFCGVFHTNNGKAVGTPGRCFNDTELNTVKWELFNVIDHGVWKLSTQSCLPGMYAIWDNATWSWTCLPCPAGTHSSAVETDRNLTLVCVPCGPGSAAPPRSSLCEACGKGNMPSPTNESCIQCPAGTYSDAGAFCVPCLGSLQSLP